MGTVDHNWSDVILNKNLGINVDVTILVHVIYLSAALIVNSTFFLGNRRRLLYTLIR